MVPTDMGQRLQRIALAIVGLLVFAFLVVFVFRALGSRHLAHQTAEASTTAPTVEVVRVPAAGNGGVLTLPGETAAWYESTIFARVNGFVGHWHADIGDHVKSGDVLALIDTPELDAELQAAQAKLQVSVAQVKVKEAEAAFAASTFARWKDSPKGVVSDQEREDKRAGDSAAAAQLAAARAQVNLDEANVHRLAAFEQFKKVTAPFAGTVVERRIDIGNLVTAGSSTGNTPLYRLSQDDPMRVFVDVPQSAASMLMKAGTAAEIEANGVRIPAQVTRTSGAINPQARTFRAELDVPNPTRRLVPGLYVRVAFHLGDDGLPAIPAAALSFGATGPRVAVVTHDDTVHFRGVSIARDDGDQVQIGEGVSSGDLLVLNVSNEIVDGQKVSPAVAAPEPPVGPVAH